MTEPAESPFRNYTDKGLLIYIAAAGENDPLEMELEAIREAKRRVDAGAIHPQAFKDAMDKNYYAAQARDARPKPSPPAP
jgi:hypothetical protein